MIRRTYLKSRRQRRPTTGKAWRDVVVTEPCVMGPEGCEGRLEGHHVIAQGKLRKVVPAGELEPALNDPRNGLVLCERHHRRHTNGYERVPYDLVPDAALVFALEHGLVWWIRRFYPVVCDLCGERITNEGAHFESCRGAA